MLYFLVIISNFLNSYLNKRSTFFPVFGMAVLAYLAANAGPLGSLDYGTYSRGYSSISYTNTNQFEWGYTILEKCSLKFNLDYDQFRAVIFTISFLVLFIAIKKITKNVAEFTWLFSIFPFINEANQVRNFAMMSFAILALSFYMSNQKIFIPLFLVIISASFHSLGYIFVLVILISKVIKKINIKYVVLSSGLGVLISLFFLFFSSSVEIIGKIITRLFILIGRSDGSNSEAIYSAYGSGAASSTKLIFMFLMIFILITLYFSCINIQFSDFRKKQVDILIISVFIVSLVGIILVPSSVQNQRILRNAITLLLILHSLLNEMRENDTFVESKVSNITRKIALVAILVISVNVFDGGYFSKNSMIQPTIEYLLQLKGQ